MFSGLFARTKKRRPPPAPRRPVARLEVERLEDRTVPVAVRNVPGFGANTLPANDDGSTALVNVGFDLNFFGVMRDQVFVNNNGNITFDQALSQFTPTALNSDNGGIPIIAAFFADVDTRAGNEVTYGTDTVCGIQAFGVNWIDVGYFAQNTDRLNTFQLILFDRSDTGVGNFDIEFNYDTINWETGDASGGTGGLGGESARVGFSNGTGTPGTFFELPGSGQNGAFLDGGPRALASNLQLATTPGRYHFMVRNGQVIMDPQPVDMVNMEVTDATRVLYPLRYLAHLPSGNLRGNLTLINFRAQMGGGPTGPGPDLTCLDIPGEMTAGTIPTTFPGPITVVFPQLQSNVTGEEVTLVNATGVTASGDPFITIDVPALPPLSPVLRTQIVLDNPGSDAISTFYLGFPVRVFAGEFDPSRL